ncbi:MAG: ethanolamine ammonia-lyase subunit EutB [Desulforhopalus sp.]|nr:ethanolamine ammonia-lyase subunit EutB [Desulforhopalus sp.]
MLNYQPTSFHDVVYLRKLLNRAPAPEFAAWQEKMSIYDRQRNLFCIQSGNTLLQIGQE